MPTRVISINAIEVPKKWRVVKKKTVAELVLSLRQEGLLHAIGVRPTPVPGKFMLVFGRHRLEAAKKAGWTEIEAKVMDISEKAAEGATTAENLFRNNLNAAERVIALKAWSEQYVAEHPEVHGRGKAGGTARQAKAVEKATGKAPELPKTFPEHASEQTGIPATTIKNTLATGRNLSEEEMGVMAEREVPLEHIRKINKLPAEQRKEAVALVAAGQSAIEAVAQASLPANATIETVAGDPEQGAKAEADMSDDEWLEHFCGDVLARLKYKAAFVSDALLYRKTRDALHKLKTGTKTALSQSKAKVVGPFFLIFAKLVNTDHPSRWNPCGKCGGSGQSGDKAKCGFCNGHAYSTK
jgi:ParB family chromosome partitioning protein